MSRTAQEEKNLSFATEMYESVLLKMDSSKVDQYFAPDYIQHGSLAADGREPVKELMDRFRKEYPDIKIMIKRVFVDGDFVIFHVHGKLDPSLPGEGDVVVDIFRMQDGLIQEHWEVIQAIPESLPHSNGMI